jgi:cold shock CspA family protein
MFASVALPDLPALFRKNLLDYDPEMRVQNSSFSFTNIWTIANCFFCLATEAEPTEPEVDVSHHLQKKVSHICLSHQIPISMPTGIISHFQFAKNIGFIRCPELRKEKIYFHLSNCLPGYKSVQIGDHVEFDLLTIDNRTSGAQSISLLGNPSLKDLISDFEKGKSRTGVLLKFRKLYVVEDDLSGIFVKIESPKEFSRESSELESYENLRIRYRITDIPDRNDLSGIFLSEDEPADIDPILDGASTEAEVTERVKGGFQLRFLQNYSGFIPYQLATRWQQDVVPGDHLDVVLIRANLQTANFVFDLSRNMEARAHRLEERIQNIPSYRIGEVIRGTVSHAVSYGVFVSLGETDGFLHISEILGENPDVPLSGRRKMSEKMHAIFRSGTPVLVEILQLSKDKITLTWDPMTTENYRLFEDIFSAYKGLKENLW